MIKQQQRGINRAIHPPEMSGSDCNTIRVALVGCGAISEQMHLPIVAGHERLELAGIVDRDMQRATKIAKAYGVEKCFSDIDEINTQDFDAAIVATPPLHHAPATISLMQRGIHVLVEKPMATNYRDATTMVGIAKQQNVALSVCLFRRLYPSLQLLKALIDSEYFGRPVRVDLEGGSVYGWAAATLGNMKKELAGGGVLMDMGPHYIDQLLYLFPGDSYVDKYEDNSLGGIEADCKIQLRLNHRGAAVRTHIVLSRTRSLRNTLIVECERGTFEIGFSERAQVAVRPQDLSLNDPATGLSRGCTLSAGWSDYVEKPWYESFRAEIDDWVDAIIERRQPRLSGESALASMRLIDDCYSRREALAEPWIEHPLRNAVDSSSSTSTRRVLVTGATGFIGCRLAEVLAGRDGYAVRTLVHNPANASRLARLPVEMIQGDLRDAAAVSEALRDCDAVVHCAVGTTYGDNRQIRQVTVGGTKALLDAVEKHGSVRRFVHLSSIAVYGDSHTQAIDENTPVGPNHGDRYGQTKLQAEQAVLAAAERGLSAFVLRPGCVFGPFGATFTTRPLLHLRQERLVLQGSADVPSNTIYVDNLVEAIVRCLETDKDTASRTFNISDDDGTTWGDFYGYFADAAGLALRYSTKPPQTGVNGRKRRGALAAVGGLLTSTEFKEFGKLVLTTDTVGALPRFLIERVPGVEAKLKRLIGSDRPNVYERKVSNSGDDLIWTTARHVAVSSSHIRTALGYRPAFSRSEAMQRTFDWARQLGVI